MVNFLYLDLGSNIGAFTVPVASMRRQVVAVDMMKENLHYIRMSLWKAGLLDFVHLVNRAVRYFILN